MAISKYGCDFLPFTVDRLHTWRQRSWLTTREVRMSSLAKAFTWFPAKAAGNKGCINEGEP
jgi:hypothetical protein